MQHSSQIKKVINFYKLWIFLVIFIFLFASVLLVIITLRSTSLNLSKDIFLNLSLSFSLSLLSSSIILLKRLFEKICFLRILKEKIEKGDRYDRETAKRIFDQLVIQRLLRSNKVELKSGQKEIKIE